MNRRKFIQNSALAIVGINNLPALAHSLNMEKQKTDFGVALFILPKTLSSNFERTIRRISETGYKELESWSL